MSMCIYLDEVSKLKADYLNENEKLTNLLLDAELEIERLQAIAQQAHDRILRGDSDNELLIILESAWKKRPNARANLPATRAQQE